MVGEWGGDAPFRYAVLSLEQERYRNQRENNGEEARQKKSISLILIMILTA